MYKSALLFVNGEPPRQFPEQLDKYDVIACTDGAYSNYLNRTPIIPQFIIGDLDSTSEQESNPQIQIIHTPDQDRTDFEKALIYLANLGIKQFDIYGATGRASDHFLGNLSVALRYYRDLDLTFYDNYCRFFFVIPPLTIDNVKDKIISFIPLTRVDKINVTGVEYPLINADLTLNGLVSLRNKANQDLITINFSHGDLVVFIAL